MSNNFKVSNNGGDDWLICWTGQDEKGVHWNVTTDQVHASQLFEFSKGAEEDARLIAKLLDMHYTGQLIHTESIQNKLTNFDALQDTNARLINAAAGRGMVSEMDNMQEVAVLVCGLHDKIQALESDIKAIEANYDALQSPMPCGHLARYAVNGEEGTQYCALCVLEADKQTIANLENFIRTRNVVCTWCGFKVVYDNENEEEKQAARDAVNAHALVCEKDPRTVELETIKKASQNLVNELPLKVLVQDLKSIDALLDLLKPKETHHE